MPFPFLLRDDPLRRDARAIYAAAVAQARQPGFYAALGVPDTLDGRFDMIVLHVVLLVRRLSAAPEAGARVLGQAVFDGLFDDMDRSLRELGVGDLGVGRRIKAMAEAYYGRAAAYDAALAAGDDGPLAEALRRNLFAAGAPPAAEALAGMCRYARAAASALAAQPVAALRRGELGLPPAPPAGH